MQVCALCALCALCVLCESVLPRLVIGDVAYQLSRSCSLSYYLLLSLVLPCSPPFSISFSLACALFFPI